MRNLTISQPFEWRLPPSVMVLDNLEFTTTDIETPRQGVVEQWNLIDVTPDPHPIHVHLVTFRILGRQPFDVDAYTRRFPQPAVGTRWTPPADDVVTGPLDPPAPWEAGAKDTVRADGGTITRIVVRFPTAGELGFDPDETFAPPGRTAAHEAGDDAGHEPAELQGYVWHCHVLDHEDHDMMLRYRLLP